MGIRPNKAIGWGITIKGSDLYEQKVDDVINENNLSYTGFIDYLENHELMNSHIEARLHHKGITKEKFSKLDKDRKIFNYMEIIEEKYDSDECFENQVWTIIFYPMVLSPLAFYEDYGIGEFKVGDSPFTYAEIEHFFPESMDNLETVSYNIKTPPFPSDYSVIHNNNKKTVESFRTLNDKTIFQDVKQCLIRGAEDSYSEIFSTMVGFKNFEELQNAYCLAPAEEVFALAQYSGIFKSESVAFELKPIVAYYWF